MESPSRPTDFDCEIEISKVYYGIQCVAASHNQRQEKKKRFYCVSTVFNWFMTFMLQKASLKKKIINESQFTTGLYSFTFLITFLPVLSKLVLFILYILFLFQV